MRSLGPSLALYKARRFKTPLAPEDPVFHPHPQGIVLPLLRTFSPPAAYSHSLFRVPTPRKPPEAPRRRHVPSLSPMLLLLHVLPRSTGKPAVLSLVTCWDREGQGGDSQSLGRGGEVSLSTNVEVFRPWRQLGHIVQNNFC